MMSNIQESVRASWSRLDEKMIKFMSAYGIHMIRYSLGVVFIWFGLLKGRRCESCGRLSG